MGCERMQAEVGGMSAGLHSNHRTPGRQSSWVTKLIDVTRSGAAEAKGQAPCARGRTECCVKFLLKPDRRVNTEYLIN